MKGFASLNYNLIFKILCAPKIIPFACRISLLCDLSVLSVHISLPESWDAPDDLVYVLWFVQSWVRMVSWIKLNKRKEGKNSSQCGGLTFLYIISKWNIDMTKNTCYLNLTQGSNTVIEESAQPLSLILAILESLQEWSITMNPAYQREVNMLHPWNIHIVGIWPLWSSFFLPDHSISVEKSAFAGNLNCLIGLVYEKTSWRAMDYVV